jgi:hypothetical protein
MVFLSLVVFGFSTKPLTMIRLFAELSGHYLDTGTNPPTTITLPPLPIIPVDPSAVSPSIWPGRTWTLKESANPRLFSARVCF